MSYDHTILIDGEDLELRVEEESIETIYFDDDSTELIAEEC